MVAAVLVNHGLEPQSRLCRIRIRPGDGKHEKRDVGDLSISLLEQPLQELSPPAGFGRRPRLGSSFATVMDRLKVDHDQIS
jgi:hypothetical protein